MQHSRISVIQGHNRDVQTDHLYDPLRKTFLIDTTAKKTYLDSVSRVSDLSHMVHTHNQVENHDLGETTLIPEDVKLVRSYTFSRIPEKSHYYIIDANERELDPISEDELQSRLKNKKEQIILYKFASEETAPKDKAVNPPEEKIMSRSQSRSSKIKIVSPKYNLFSVLDEPVNNLLSGKPCTCPANELIARNRNQTYWTIDEVLDNSKPLQQS